MLMDNKKMMDVGKDAVVLTGLMGGIGWAVKKATKTVVIVDPTGGYMNYLKFAGVVAGSLLSKPMVEKWLKEYKITS